MTKSNDSEEARYLEQRKKALQGLYSTYEKAKALLETEEYKLLFDNVVEMVASYQPGESSEKAIYVLAQAALIAQRIRGPREVIEKYESAQRTVKDLSLRLGLDVELTPQS